MRKASVIRGNKIIRTGDVLHIFNRGNHRDEIAMDVEDKSFIQELLIELSDKYKQQLITYCVMDNHYHLQLEVIDPFFLAKMMQSFGIRVAKRFNKKYGDVGHIFQDRYKCVILPDLFSMLYVNRYIHLNPKDLREVKTVEDIFEYPFSGLRDYLNKNPKPLLKRENIKLVMNNFSTVYDYTNFLTNDNFLEHLNLIVDKKLEKDFNQRLIASVQNLVSF